MRIPPRSGLLGAPFLLGCLLLLSLAATAQATHPRPGSATPMRVPLVSAFVPCSPSGFYFHRSGGPACPGQAYESSILGTGSNGAGSGSVKLTLFCAAPSTAGPPCTDAAGDQEDIAIVATVTDVQCVGATSPCAGAGADYTGSVIFNFPIRLNDHAIGAFGPGTNCANGAGTSPCITGTVIDANIGLVVPCVGVGAANTAPGSTCSVTTTVDTASPGTVAELQRQNFRFFDEVQVRDLGPDQSAGGLCPQLCGTGDEGITRAQGLFGP